jgi:mono/diheme cytochrome c family protein
MSGLDPFLRYSSISLVVVVIMVLGGLPVSTRAQERVDQMTIEAGGHLVANLCSRCHATESGQSSPHDQAPSLRLLSRNYPVERLAEALAEGMMVGHPDMPVFEFEASEVDQIIAYLNSIQDQ